MLPAGPTVVDIMANARVLLRAGADAGRGRPAGLDADVVQRRRGELPRRRRGTASTRTLFWPGLGDVPATELVLRRLLPLAHEGLDRWGVDPRERDRLLGIIEQRCLPGRNGATWQVDDRARAGASAAWTGRTALREMLRRYMPHMHENIPVHEWPREDWGRGRTGHVSRSTLPARSLRVTVVSVTATTSGVTMTGSTTQGIMTVLHPVSDLAAAKTVYSALLGVAPPTDSAYYVGFDAAGQQIGTAVPAVGRRP